MADTNPGDGQSAVGPRRKKACAGGSTLLPSSLACLHDRDSNARNVFSIPAPVFLGVG